MVWFVPLILVDVSVLENHHIAASFKIIHEEQYNIFVNFSRTEYKSIRERMMKNVLATDMAKHFAEIGHLK